jgi:hypothetical protein
MSPLQLSEFSQLTPIEKKKLLERNRKMQNRELSLLSTIAKQLKAPEDWQALQLLEDITVRKMKEHYQSLLKEYSQLFGRVITEYHRKHYSQLLVAPNQLGLFEE